MEFTTLILDKSGKDYSCMESSTVQMLSLGILFDREIRFNTSSYREMLDDDSWRCLGGNFVSVQKDGENVEILYFDIEEKKCVSEFKMTRKQFIKLLDDWDEKVCPHLPPEVIITYDGKEFVVETEMKPYLQVK